VAHLPRIVPEDGSVSFVDEDGSVHATTSVVMAYRDSSGTATDVTHQLPMPAAEFKLMVQLGEVPGWSMMSGLGEYESGNIDAAGEDVCRFEDVGGPARLPTPSSAGVQMTVVSDDNADNGATATGVITARIEYLDASGSEKTEDITITGTTVAHTDAVDIRFVNDFYSLTTGSNGVAEGNITLYEFGGDIANNLHNLIALGGNKSLVPHRMVPANKKLLLQGWSCTEAQSKRSAYRIRSTDMNGVLIPGVFCFKGVAYLNGAASGEMAVTATVPEFSIVKVSHWGIATGSEGSCAWWGYLVDV
jgi:hypothetical protein